VDFRNTVIIMTSNLGTKYMTKSSGQLGFAAGDRADTKMINAQTIEDDLKEAFRPEFLNRVDEIIIFDPLTRDQIKEIVALQVTKLLKNLSDQKLNIELSDAAKAWLGERGYDIQFGARPLKRVIMRQIENPLSKRLLAGDFVEGDTIHVDVGADNESLTFTKVEVPATAEVETEVEVDA